MQNTLGITFLKVLEAEVEATRKCLERIPTDIGDWKPHEKSMRMDYLTQLVAEIPGWIAAEVTEGTIDLGTYPHDNPDESGGFAGIFDKGMEKVRAALTAVTDEQMTGEMFTLTSGGNELMKMSKEVAVSSTINHLVHHRGQLTVYMRLKDIKVPSLYGPSADEPGF